MISTPASGLRISERQWKAWIDEDWRICRILNKTPLAVEMRFQI